MPLRPAIKGVPHKMTSSGSRSSSMLMKLTIYLTEAVLRTLLLLCISISGARMLPSPFLPLRCSTFPPLLPLPSLLLYPLHPHIFLSLPLRLSHPQRREERIGFVTWQYAPSLIASEEGGMARVLRCMWMRWVRRKERRESLKCLLIELIFFAVSHKTDF